MNTNTFTRVLAATAILFLTSCATRSHHTANFNGVWSNEGDIKVDHFALADVQQDGNTFDGTLRIEEYDPDGELTYSSGLASIVDGTITGNRGSFDIYSQRGQKVGSGTFCCRGDDLHYKVCIDRRNYRGVLWPAGSK